MITDPAFPFAFSAEPTRLRLRWHHCDPIRWRTRMIVLTLEPGEARSRLQAPWLELKTQAASPRSRASAAGAASRPGRAGARVKTERTADPLDRERAVGRHGARIVGGGGADGTPSGVETWA